MADLHATPQPSAEKDDRSAPLRLRIGQFLFLAYLTLYTGYVLLNAFAVATIERVQLFGLNLAVNYGLALIAVAFVLAVAYDVICRVLIGRALRSEEERG